MTDINLRELVEQAVDRDWKSFEDDHPMLASILDRRLLIEHVSSRLRGDVEFHKAMSDGQAVSALLEFMIESVRPIVRRVIDQLIG